MATFRKLPSGNWQALIRLSGQPTKAKTFPTKDLAKAWAAGIELDVARGRAGVMGAQIGRAHV